MSTPKTVLSTSLAVLLMACSQPNTEAAEVASAPDATSPAETSEPSTPEAAGGGSLDDVQTQMVQSGAKMKANAVACELGTEAEAEKATQELRGKYVGQGVDGAEFDRVYQAAYDETMAKVEQASPAQREQACAQIRSMGEQMEQAFRDSAQ